MLGKMKNKNVLEHSVHQWLHRIAAQRRKAADVTLNKPAPETMQFNR
jgi:hypothetical protein